MRALHVVVAASLVLAACSRSDLSNETQSAAAVDTARLVAADQDAANWMSYGRTYDEQRFSPLQSINTENVSQLKLAWYYDLDTAHRAQESTPLVIDGVMYVTSAWSKLFALDAATGKELWRFDPKVPGEAAINACCDVVNRGVAAFEGKLFLGTLDGRLIAVDARKGTPVWEVDTTEPGWRYTITGAPRVVKGKVIIGNGGAELGVRGYVSAYDAATGKLVWRFYTVPGDPSKPFENKAMEEAAKTWTGEWWKLGGGGTVWDAMAYDPELDLLYIGVGNGSPWNRALRSPGGGDNLFLSSIVALRPDTGEYVWHFQTTPGETWDYTATQHIMLADLTIDGKLRKVAMQAPKNGFFYVIDRATGEFISANNFTEVNWAKGIDPKTGRPIENPEARFGEIGKPFVAIPGPGGAHSWQPMAFSPQTGLVYFPVNEWGFPYIPVSKLEPQVRAWNTGVDFNAGSLPQDEKVKEAAKAALKGHLAAWDPVAQREVWRVQYEHPWNGGVLATAGGLVFHGDSMGEFSAFRADNGEKLWSAQTQAGILAAPITYEVGGEQYVVIEVGWGGAFGLAAGELARDAHIPSNLPRVLAFKLNGTASLPPLPEPEPRPLTPPPATADARVVDQGKALYHTYCGTCHGDTAVSGGVIPDLRYSAAISTPALWESIVRRGALTDRGMVSFGEALTPEQTDAIRAYIIQRANDDAAKQGRSGSS